MCACTETWLSRDIIGERARHSQVCSIEIRDICVYIYCIPYALTVHFPITQSARYLPIFHTLYFKLHCACALNNVVLTTIIEMVEILDGRVGKHSVERVRYVIKLFTRSPYFHSPSICENPDTDSCNKSYVHIVRVSILPFDL